MKGVWKWGALENNCTQEEKVTGLRRRVQNWGILIYIGMLPETFHYLRRQEKQSEMGKKNFRRLIPTL
jgi:hypothetical protein